MPSSPDTGERPFASLQIFALVGGEMSVLLRGLMESRFSTNCPQGERNLPSHCFNHPRGLISFSPTLLLNLLIHFKIRRVLGRRTAGALLEEAPPRLCAPPPSLSGPPHTQHVLSGAALSSPVLSSFSIAYCSWWHLHPAKQPRSPVSFSTPLRNQIMNSVSL